MDRDYHVLKRTTVGDLIDALNKLPKDALLFSKGYEGGYHDHGCHPEKITVALNVHGEWYYGPHEEVGMRASGDEIVEGYLL